MKEFLALVTIVFLCSAPFAFSQEIDYCKADFDCDSDVDGADSAYFRSEFGRNQFNNPCTLKDTCKADFDCDGDVDGTDLSILKEEYGRSIYYNNPCPGCFNNLCEYEECTENCGAAYPEKCPDWESENCASGKCGVFNIDGGTKIMCIGDSPSDDACSNEEGGLGTPCCEWKDNFFVFDTYTGILEGEATVCCDTFLLDGNSCDCIYSAEPVFYPYDCCSGSAARFDNDRVLCIRDQSDLDNGTCLWNLDNGKLYVFEGYVEKINDIYYICQNGLKIPTDLKCTGGFYGKEMIGRVTENSATINMVPCQDNVSVYVEYGLLSGNYEYQSETMMKSEREPIEIILDDLLPETRYYYRAMEKPFGDSSFSPRREGKFITKRNIGSSFKFAVTSDDHYKQIFFIDYHKQVLRKTFENIYDDNVDFHIDLGDSFCTDYGIELDHDFDIKSQENGYTTYETLKGYYSYFHHSIPFYFVLGNHEGELGFNWVDLAEWSENSRKLHIPNPNSTTYPEGGSDDENYYAFTWGDALFIALDPYRYTLNHPEFNGLESWTLGTTQLNWLESVLENSNANHKFIFIHHLVGGCNGYGRGGVKCVDNGEWGSIIHPLLVENNVDIVFHGHDHAFSDEIKDGIRYTLVPIPHDFENSWADDYRFYDPENVILSPGHIRASVSDNVFVEYVGSSLDSSNKEVKHSYIISP